MAFYTNDAERMRITSGGNVGIGTTSPSGILHVLKSAADVYIESNGGTGNTSRLILKNTAREWRTGADTDGAFWHYDATAGSYRFLINTSGNVGIGTTSPGSYNSDFNNLVIANTSSYAGMTIATASSSYGTIAFADGTSGDQKYRGYIQYSHTDDAMLFGSTATERMRITSGGNLQLTNANPTIDFVTNTTTTTTMFSIVGAQYVGSAPFNANILRANNSSHIAFETGGSERMRITSGGVVLVNQTSLSAAGAGQKMQIATDVLSTGSLAGYFWENRSGGVTSNSNWYGWYATSGTVYMYNGSSNIASINTSTGAYTALSDINKKKDFEDSTIGLNAILGLKPTLYRMKSENGTEKHLGFIAQQVKEFIPQAYIQTKGEKEDFIGIDDRPIIAALVKGIQELKQELDTLKNK